MSDQYVLLTEPLFVLGSGIGYEREVLLWTPPTDDEVSAWQVPNAALVYQLFHWLDVPKVTAAELKSFVERRLLTAPNAPHVGLSCALLPKQRFERLQARMMERSVTIFKVFKYREIVKKTSPFDWQTVCMLLYAFEHLDR
ncbi:MAG: hypothetical protein WC866_00880 [Patescibacteria group bacterium]